MGMAVVTVASGGLPVVDVTATTPKLGLPVTEATNGRGVAVTKVVGKPGLAVTFVAPPLLLRESDGETDRGRAGNMARRARGAATRAQ
jgi:hypothetical protein